MQAGNGLKAAHILDQANLKLTASKTRQWVAALAACLRKLGMQANQHNDPENASAASLTHAVP